MDLKSLFVSDEAATALKWAAMILAAGFIAPFGKKTTDYLIGRFRSRQGAGAARPPGPRRAVSVCQGLKSLPKTA